MNAHAVIVWALVRTVVDSSGLTVSPPENLYVTKADCESDKQLAIAVHNHWTNPDATPPNQVVRYDCMPRAQATAVPR
jgi:hypothetical protein